MAVSDVIDQVTESVEFTARTNGFHLEPRCRVCRNDEMRNKVNDLLATGASYAHILRTLGEDNAQLDKRLPDSSVCRSQPTARREVDDGSMDTAVDEIAPGVFRLSTWTPDITDEGFTFNQFLLTGEQPFLFHCGMRQLFPLVSQAIERVIPLAEVRWISLGHIEADECGAMNMLLNSAPHAEVIHGPLACMLSLNDMCDRPPVVADDTPLDIGGHRLRFITTPHVPHNWEAGLWFDETTSTLLGGDLLTHVGKPPPLTESDLVGKAIAAEELFHATGLTTVLTPTLHQLADLQPTTLALMHGASFTGDGAAQLRGLAAGYAELAAR